MALMTCTIEARTNQASTRGQVHETSLPKIGTVRCNKASHLLAQAKPSQSKFAEPSQAKPSLIYKYAKKGVLPEDKVGPCSTSSTSFYLILSGSRQYNGMVRYHFVLHDADDVYFILRQGRT